MNKAKPQDVPDFSWPNGPAALLPAFPQQPGEGDNGDNGSFPP